MFSFERAKQPNSDMKELIGSITEVRAVDDYTVEIVTDGPNPILPSNLTNLFMMDKDWTEANDTVNVQDFEGGEITFATTNTNGTGPYVLQSREPDVKTVMVRNEDYWGYRSVSNGRDRDCLHSNSERRDPCCCNAVRRD